MFVVAAAFPLVRFIPPSAVPPGWITWRMYIADLQEQAFISPADDYLFFETPMVIMVERGAFEAVREWANA